MSDKMGYLLFRAELVVIALMSEATNHILISTRHRSRRVSASAHISLLIASLTINFNPFHSLFFFKVAPIVIKVKARSGERSYNFHTYLNA